MSQVGLHIAEAIASYTIDSASDLLTGLLPSAATTDLANQTLQRLTGIQNFFPDHKALDAFRQAISTPKRQAPPKGRQWGDFQTPPKLARQICDYLAAYGIAPGVVIEPTYGMGNFILAALDTFPGIELIYGVEIQEKYAWQLKMALMARALHGQPPAAEIILHQDNIFAHRFTDRIRQAQNILIIGNPPWVTNAELGALEASNLPVKRNIKALRGLDAVTGKGNFDLGEYVLLRLLELFSNQHGALAMLCKNAVIKNILAALPRQRFKVAKIHALEIDAQQAFGAAVDASLLVMTLGADATDFTCQVASLDDPKHVLRVFGWTQDRFVSNLTEYSLVSAADGQSPLVWRQGLKHDCARVMELTQRGNTLINGNGEAVEVEADYIYSLLKSSDLQNFIITNARKKVIVTQKSLEEDTRELRQQAPKLWAYLVQHREALEKRKSSIYRNKPPFAIFGIGVYTFQPYKVAISGLYKEPCFSMVLPDAGRPMVLDDTCYFLGFDRFLDALFTASLLNSALAREFLKAIAFRDAKRPFTKEVLMRIDLVHIAAQTPFDAVNDLWRSEGYQPQRPITEPDYEQYRHWLAALAKESPAAQLSLGIL